MGSRALIVLARTQSVAEKRFGVHGGSRGVVVTRTGRRFFNDAAIEEVAMHRLDAAMEASGLWHELGTDWVLWDAEIMPWSMKAGSLIRGQYAAVGSAAIVWLGAASQALAAARARGWRSMNSRQRRQRASTTRCATARPITAMSSMRR